MKNRTIEELKQSPLFNLSLSNKELFHSNFIAWFGKEYPNLFCDFINKLLNDKGKGWDKDLHSTDIIILREYKHFDICVMDSERRLRLIIENKVKSIPTKEQLSKYTDESQRKKSKGDDTIPITYILLSMNTKFQDENTEDKSIGNWICIDYKKVSDALSNAKKTVKEYHRQLIEDYCQYIKNLQSVIEKYDKSDRLLMSKDEDKNLKDLDIHDLCGKRRIQRLYQMIYYKLSQKYIIVGKREDLIDDASKKNIYMGWGFSNATPMLTIIFKTRQRDNAQIQIQGLQYRHGVEIAEEQMNKRIIYENDKKKNNLSETGKQYFLDNYSEVLLGENAIKHYPQFSKNQILGQREEYCKFAPKNQVDGKYLCFVYQYVKMPESIVLKDLVNYISNDLDDLWILMGHRTNT